MASTGVLQQGLIRSREEAQVFRSAWLVGPVFDSVFLIFSPLLAMALGWAIAGTALTESPIRIGQYEAPPATLFIGAFIMAHIFIVFFRSHLNREIFRQYPFRFVLVPVALFLAMMWSPWIAVSVSVLATWWDVYHSSLQTFGIGRIYDAKVGNDSRRGRTLDIILNLYLYAGPILAGATLMDHVEDFYEFEEVGSVFFTAIPAYVESHASWLTWAVLLTGVPFLVYYVYCYWRWARQGYRVSFQKVALLVSTALCSIVTWGFNPFGEAFFIMNFFHAWQYFALVWWVEKKNIARTFGVEGKPWAPWLALALLLAVGFGYGLWAEMNDGTSPVAYNLIIVIAIMHFWYDGFIWSVRKKMV